jgi:hypothetical protein
MQNSIASSDQIILGFDHVSRMLAEKIDDFLGKYPDRGKELISLLVKFMKHANEIREILDKNSSNIRR